MLSAFLSARVVLGSRGATIEFLAPFWDLYAFCVWVTSYTGTHVRWRDQILAIDPEGRIWSVQTLPEGAC
jgi:hypothetical protein